MKIIFIGFFFLFFIVIDNVHSTKCLPSKNTTNLVKKAYQISKQIQIHSSKQFLRSKLTNEKNIWEVCSKLHELSKFHIELLTTHQNCTLIDTITWLSSTLTCFQHCDDELFELKHGQVKLLENSSVGSQLILEALQQRNSTTTKEYKEDFEYHEDGFPLWLGKNEKSILELPTSSSLRSHPHITVAQDDSGDFRSIQEALQAIGSTRMIYIKQGVYLEYLELSLNMTNVIFVGDGIGKTIISGNRSVIGSHLRTLATRTIAIFGHKFLARGITFQNTAGPQNEQAVALLSSSDQSVFYQCGFEGFQDTLLIHLNRQFFRECDIYGTVDYIFGFGAAVIQRSNIFARFPPDGVNTITAQGKYRTNTLGGFSIHQCRITAAPNVSLQGVKTYLGRPWKKFSQTVVLRSFMDSLIEPKGWLEWNGIFALNTLFYAEFQNRGPGSSTTERVKWQGYHVIKSSSEAMPFTIANFIKGDSWLPNTKVPYISGL